MVQEFDVHFTGMAVWRMVLILVWVAGVGSKLPEGQKSKVMILTAMSSSASFNNSFRSGIGDAGCLNIKKTCILDPASLDEIEYAEFDLLEFAQ